MLTTFKHAESIPASMLNPIRFKLAEMGIQDRIAEAISESDMTKSAIAKACGVSPSAVTQWLSGETRAPTAERLLKLARITGFSYTWLVEGKGPRRHADEVADKALARRESNADLIDTEVTEDDEPLRPDEVMLPVFRECEFAAGDGSTQVVENHGQSMRFSLAKLAARGVQPQNAGLAVAKGDSMKDEITDGALIGIDKGVRHIVDGDIYALDHGGMLRVKRLYRMPLNRVRVTSDNAEEYPEEVYSLADPDAPQIIGRIFYVEKFL